MTPPVALTIAGSDSGGGAGIQADLKTFAALGVFGTCALTAVTAQNTTAVRGVLPVPAEFVMAQVHAVLEDLQVSSVKTGMLGTVEVVRAVADLAADGRLPRLVVDPVMVASSGARLLDRDAETTYVECLLPHAWIVTPNVLEAQVLLGSSITTLADQYDAARALGELGPEVVIVKGGHAVSDAKDQAVDVVWDGSTISELRSPRVDTRNDHGTGCTLAAATAAMLARGAEPVEAIARAKDFVSAAIRGGAAWQLGSGHGPLDHFRWARHDPTVVDSRDTPPSRRRLRT